MGCKFEILLFCTTILILISSSLCGMTVAGVLPPQLECLIKNEKYQFDYLFAGEEQDTLTTAHEISSHRRKQIYVLPLGLINNYDQIKWIIVPIASVNKSEEAISSQNKQRESRGPFLIKSKTYENEFLCASHQHSNGLFKARRKVINNIFFICGRNLFINLSNLYFLLAFTNKNLDSFSHKSI